GAQREEGAAQARARRPPQGPQVRRARVGARRGSGGRRSSPAIAAWALCAAALGSGCLLRTDAVPAAFNDGVLDSGGDPARDPKQRRESIVDRLVWDEVIDGYFGQGPDHGAGYSVAGW